MCLSFVEKKKLKLKFDPKLDFQYESYTQLQMEFQINSTKQIRMHIVASCWASRPVSSYGIVIRRKIDL